MYALPKLCSYSGGNKVAQELLSAYILKDFVCFERERAPACKGIGFLCCRGEVPSCEAKAGLSRNTTCDTAGSSAAPSLPLVLADDEESSLSVSSAQWQRSISAHSLYSVSCAMFDT